MMSAPLLQVESMTLVTHQGPIIRDVSFEIAPGEIVALTGKSGSGKTSIALAILNLLPPGVQMPSGKIRWMPGHQEEHVLPAGSGYWPALRGSHIGYTQQDAFGAFDPVVRMGDQMMMIIRERSNLTGPDAMRELRIKMEEVGLHDIDRLWVSYPHQLSGGQLQRCQIAMSIVIHPELLISDEPTSAIDKINQLELLDVFSMLRTKYNMAILCITHEEAVIRHLADREVQIGEITYEFPLPQPVLKRDAAAGVETIVEARGLIYTHTYGGMLYTTGATIGPLDFSVNRGYCLGIVGESGSGKSTLAQLLVGLYKPLSGQVLLQGQKIDFHKKGDLRMLRSRVQLVMQDGRGSLHPNLTVRTLLTEVIRSHVTDEAAINNALIQSLSETGLPVSVLDRKPQFLSGGECLRVSIARALLMEPELLICDESTSSLDGASRDGIIALLQSLMKSRGMALVFISHDERIIRGLAHDVLVLAKGHIVEKGTAAEVITYPTHPVTQKIFTTHATLQHKKHP